MRSENGWIGVAHSDVTLSNTRASLASVVQSALAIGSVGLLSVSLFVSWWAVQFSYPTSGGTVSGTIHFLPGASAQAIINGASISLPYSVVEGSVAWLYGTVQIALISVAVAAGLAAVLAVISSASIKSRPWASMMAAAFNVIAVVGLVLLVGLFPIAEPQSLPNGPNSVFGGCPNPSSPCGSFYGTFSGYGGPSSWGPEAGWYLAIVALALLVIVVSLSFASRRDG